jgi:hypothetical protein
MCSAFDGVIKVWRCIPERASEELGVDPPAEGKKAPAEGLLFSVSHGATLDGKAHTAVLFVA